MKRSSSLQTHGVLLVVVLFFTNEPAHPELENQPTPQQPTKISVVASGPYRAPAQIELVASVTHPENCTISRVEFYSKVQDKEGKEVVSFLGKADKEPYEITYPNVPMGHYRIEARAYVEESIVATATREFEVLPSNRYNRGWGKNQNFLSSIIALDFQRGVLLDDISDFRTLFSESKYPFYPWFLRLASSLPELHNPCYYLDTRANTLNYSPINSLPKIGDEIIGGQPPFVAFGSQGGGTPLYINQDYHFGIAAGGKVFGIPNNPDILIEVYDKEDFKNGATNIAPICSKSYSLPSFSDEQEWKEFLKQEEVIDYHFIDKNPQRPQTPIDFDTQVQYTFLSSQSPIDSWGQGWAYPLHITHRAANSAYYYKISIMGTTRVIWLKQDGTPTTLFPDLAQKNPGIITNINTGKTYNLTYTLDFDDPAPWSTTLITLPHFQGKPLPSAYAGKSVDELIHQAPLVKDTLTSLNPDFTKLDNNNPELKNHPELDKLVEECDNDPLNLANYVQNEIELTDAIGLNVVKDSSPFSINSQGVMRDALATYMEGQGSPIEQCGLLIYLLRKVGVPAAYVFPEHDGTLIFDEQLSKMLHTQLRGTMNFLGPSAVPELIPVNYPWVRAYINGKWIHLFPWIKDTKVSEGRDLWNYFPTDYNTATKWLVKYLYNDPAIRDPWGTRDPSVTTDPDILSDDNPGTLFPLYAQEQLAKEHLTLEDIGIRFINQPHQYIDWNDFPRPWRTPIISKENIVASLEEHFFDTLEIKIFSNRSGKGASDPSNPLLLETGEMRFADLHDRRLLLYHEIIPGTTNPDYQMILSLEPYDSTSKNSEKITHTFKKGTNPDLGNFCSAQKMSATLSKSDNALSVQIITQHHREADQTSCEYFTQFPGLEERRTWSFQPALQKGEMAALGINYGRVTPRMRDFELQKYLTYLEEIKANSSLPANPEVATGQILQLMAKGYYYYCSQFRSELENLTKTHMVTSRAIGLSKLSPERNADGSPVTTTNNGKLDFNLVYPRVDMFFSADAWISNATAHAESGESRFYEANEIERLFTLESSSQEHRIINEIFNQKSAISTVRLLDIAQGWTPQTGKATHPGANILFLTEYNYEDKTPYSAIKQDGTLSSKRSFQEWGDEYHYGIWGAIKNTFENEAPNSGKKVDAISIANQAPVVAPGQNGKPFTGMGAMTLSLYASGATISDSHDIDNGGFGGATTPISSSTPDNNNAFNQQINTWMNKVLLDQAMSQIQNQLHAGNATQEPSPAPRASAQPTPEPTPTPSQNLILPSPTTSSPIATPLPRAQIPILKKEVSNNGFLGAPSYYGKLLNHIMDPVSVVTGEFYVNTLDLKLNGPMPLEIRRTYGSQNLGDNNLGGGWKLGYFPYLMLSADGSENTPATLIYAAETDGSVVAYRYDPNQQLWAPQPSDNPNLINPNDGTLGPSQNLLNNVIRKNDDATYVLSGSDGTKRSFGIKSFPVVGSPDITRTRPYLQTWQDNQGNGYSFKFGENNKNTDYGELSSITSNNGNSLHLCYDTQGHIVEAFSSDGRHLKYEYDNFGDLVKVILPDHSAVTYAYGHAKDEHGIYSTHLLTQENTPNGRILQNSYDTQRRVVTQASTVGVSPRPTRSATFSYSVSGTNADNTIHGRTSLQDAGGNTTIYSIASSQISKITYPQNKTITQTWSPTLRALMSRTDARGLVTTFGYDAQGNLTSRTLQGNITGNSNNETAKTSYSYNGNNMVTSITGPVGNVTSYCYGDSSHPMSPTSITKMAEGKTVSSSTFTYGNFGLPTSMTLDGFTTSYGYDSHGFLTGITKATGTSDPNVTTKITTNKRGEIVSECDSRGIVKKYSYDAFGRPTFEEVFEPDNKPVDWHGWYYNWNGELEWEQGARFNPVDYTYYDYDRAGHLLHKGVWLSCASKDGKGVTSSGIAATEYGYDALGNCLSIIDPNGNKTTMTYDALGNMLSRSLGHGAANEYFTYEPGGKVATHTTVLGGTESNNHNSLGQILSASQADGTTSSYLYDLSGRLVKETLPNGTTSKISYNGNTVTRAFVDAQGKSLGSTSESYDGRGHLISKTDLAASTWNFSYDGLGRLKSQQGPISQKTYIYKPGCISWVNAKGEWQNTFVDGVGRPVLTTLFNADGSVAYKESNQYSGDHQSVTTTMGTGSNAITTTSTTDLQGRAVLIEYGDGSKERVSYDACGNKTSFQDALGNVTTWSYDPLNHLASEILPGATQMDYTYNAAGELVTRSMPGGIIEQNEYDKAGQKVSDTLIGNDGSKTRNHTYGYQNGLVSGITDPRGFSTSITYDAWGHPASITSRGSQIPEQNQNTSYTYDPRGLLTSVAQSDANATSGSSGASTLVSRAYDAEGHLTSESTLLHGKLVSSWNQTWDAAGNRTGVAWNLDKQGPAYGFSYNALGMVTGSQMMNVPGGWNGSQAQTATCSYAYGDHGLLLSKQTPAGTTVLTRDGCGNIINTKLPDGSIESLSWRAGQKLASYSIVGTQNETRNYGYDTRGRLVQEPYTLMESVNPSLLAVGTHTATYLFDQNPLVTGKSQENGIGVRTAALVDTTPYNQFTRLDPIFAQTLDLSSNGSHNLSNWSYDEEEELFNHYFGDEHYNQALTWDSFGRLVSVVGGQENYTWKTTYDGLGRRIQTTFKGTTVNYYYDPQVEYMELGHSLNGNRTWNLFGPDRSGT